MPALTLVALLIIPLAGCASWRNSEMASRDDYLLSTAAVNQRNPQQARDVFHAKEPQGFVTTVEKGWLEVLAGKGDIGPLRQTADSLDQRRTLSISREATSFFYKETEDGYYPAEHEAIVLHLITAMAYSQAGDRKSAKIELRRAAYYLEAEYGASRQFDDPGLRLWLAALWTYVGEWQKARVDLRVASRLSKSNELKNWAKSHTPPASIVVVFSGPGPEVAWEPERRANVVSGLANLKFPTEFKPKVLRLVADGRGGLTTHYFDSAAWYERHQERNHAIKDLLGDSRYALENTGRAAAAGTTYSVGTVASGTLIVLGVATGIAVAAAGIYLGAAVQSGEMIALGLGAGLAVGGWMVGKGQDTYKASADTSSEIMRAGLDLSPYYRYVRYLPDRTFVKFSQHSSENLTASFKGAAQKFSPFTVLQSPDAKTRVSFIHIASDAKQYADSFSLAEWQEPDSKRRWMIINAAGDYGAAASHCQKLRRMSQGHWRIPSWSELESAKKNGLLNSEVNVVFARALGAGRIWTSAVQGRKTHCKQYDLKDGSESLRVDCKSRAKTLCVATLKGRKP